MSDPRPLRIIHSEAATSFGGQEHRVFKEMVAMRERGHYLEAICQPDAELTERLREALCARAGEAGAGSEPDIPFPAAYTGEFGQRRREAGVALYQSVGIGREDKDAAARLMRENYRLFGAPHVAILTVEADLGAYGVLDCGIYLGNLLMLLQANGIASIAQGALPRFSPLLRNHFAIPANRKIVCGLSFGYADPAHPVNGFRTTRAAVADAVRWVES